MTSESFSEWLRGECDPIWKELHHHPFIREIAMGTLPLEKFRFFLEQDLLYLPEFARCIALGVAKSESEEELRYFTAELTTTIGAEIPNNRKLLGEVIQMGAEDHCGAIEMAPSNLAYTSYLTALGYRGGSLDILAALLPCAWSYLEIAEGLSDVCGDHPLYTDWIGFYLTPEYRALIAKMRADFDAIAVAQSLSKPRRQQLLESFAASSRLERGFWEMAYTLERWPDAAN